MRTKQVKIDITENNGKTILAFAMPLGKMDDGKTVIEVIGIGKHLKFICTDKETKFSKSYDVDITGLAEAAYELFKTERNLKDLAEGIM